MPLQDFFFFFFLPSHAKCYPNRSFPSSFVSRFQCESKCETFLMKMTLICMKMILHAELIFIWKVSHLDSLCNRGTRELGNGLLVFQIIYRNWNSEDTFVDLMHCHGNWYDVTSTLKVKPNNRVARRHSLFTPLHILLCNLLSFHKHYNDKKPFRASLIRLMI